MVVYESFILNCIHTVVFRNVNPEEAWSCCKFTVALFRFLIVMFGLTFPMRKGRNNKPRVTFVYMLDAVRSLQRDVVFKEKSPSSSFFNSSSSSSIGVLLLPRWDDFSEFDIGVAIIVSSRCCRPLDFLLLVILDSCWLNWAMKTI